MTFARHGNIVRLYRQFVQLEARDLRCLLGWPIFGSVTGFLIRATVDAFCI